jgi:hypothetical protein
MRPAIQGENLVPFLPIITSRAALLRSVLAEREMELSYVKNQMDSVLTDMAEVHCQMLALGALKAMRLAAEESLQRQK